MKPRQVFVGIAFVGAALIVSGGVLMAFGRDPITSAPGAWLATAGILGMVFSPRH